MNIAEIYMRDANEAFLDAVAQDAGLTRLELDALLACCTIAGRPEVPA